MLFGEGCMFPGEEGEHGRHTDSSLCESLPGYPRDVMSVFSDVYLTKIPTPLDPKNKIHFTLLTGNYHDGMEG